jgi:hypothetical protein
MKDSDLSKQEMASSLLNGIANPQNYFCTVLGYIRGHSQLYVKAQNTVTTTDRPLVLAFEAVQYFEGPMRWQGLDFHLGSIDERIDLLQGGWIDVGRWLEKFADDHLLFVWERPKYRVRIFSATFHIGTTEPQIHLVYPDLPKDNRE